MFAALAKEAKQRLGEFNAQGLANTAWAFATEGQADAALFEALAMGAKQRLGEFNPQDLANTAWAFATVGHHNQTLPDQINAPQVVMPQRPNAPRGWVLQR